MSGFGVALWSGHFEYGKVGHWVQWTVLTIQLISNLQWLTSFIILNKVWLWNMGKNDDWDLQYPTRVSVAKDTFMCWTFSDQKTSRLCLRRHMLAGLACFFFFFYYKSLHSRRMWHCGTKRIVSVKNVHAMTKWSNTLTYGIKDIFLE